MPILEAIDAVEVPGTGDDFSVGLARAGTSLQEDKRFHIDFCSTQDFHFFVQGIRCNPNTVLQVTKALGAQETC